MLKIINELNRVSLIDTNDSATKQIQLNEDLIIEPHNNIIIDSKIVVKEPKNIIVVADVNNKDGNSNYIMFRDSISDNENDVVFSLFNITNDTITLKNGDIIGNVYFYKNYDVETDTNYDENTIFSSNSLKINDENDISEEIISTTSENGKQSILIKLK